jgi:prepilin-type N-terminal cleavage/methylation domain-containing protein
MHRATMHPKQERGFTLIEVLIVVIVLGVLAAIVVLGVGQTKSNALKSSCHTGVKAIELSAEALNTHLSTYPSGTFDRDSDPNPLLAVAGNGALLKGWPTSDGFQLTYSFDPTAVVDGGAGDTTYHVNVLDRNGIQTSGNSCSDL